MSSSSSSALSLSRFEHVTLRPRRQPVAYSKVVRWAEPIVTAVYHRPADEVDPEEVEKRLLYGQSIKTGQKLASRVVQFIKGKLAKKAITAAARRRLLADQKKWQNFHNEIQLAGEEWYPFPVPTAPKSPAGCV